MPGRATTAGAKGGQVDNIVNRLLRQVCGMMMILLWVAGRRLWRAHQTIT
jgi:hypothetical protein